MLNFFKRLATAEANAQRLTKEAEFYKELFELADERNNQLELKLDRETKANRKREDEFINAVITLHADKPVALPLVRQIELREEPLEPKDIEFESLVKTRMHHWIDDAKASGKTYTEAELIILEQTLRDDPQQYLI